MQIVKFKICRFLVAYWLYEFLVISIAFSRNVSFDIYKDTIWFELYEFRKALILDNRLVRNNWKEKIKKKFIVACCNSKTLTNWMMVVVFFGDRNNKFNVFDTKNNILMIGFLFYSLFLLKSTMSRVEKLTNVDLR